MKIATGGATRFPDTRRKRDQSDRRGRLIPDEQRNLQREHVRRDLVRTDVRVANGTAQIPDTPGLGVELNDEVVARYRTDR